EKPPYAYTDIIKVAILKSPGKKLTLSQIYSEIEKKFPWFASPFAGAGWKNTLRHNLSTQPCFVKLEREYGQVGKGHYWTFD
ncbi:winged helix DNA-binding domain-containing protein, partial [Violaceomyces palustris]